MPLGLTRRLLLSSGAATAAAAGGGAWSLSTGVPRAGARVLTQLEWDVVEAIAEVMFPGVHFPVNGIEAGVAERVDELVADLLDPVHANGFRYVLRALEWGTLASRGQQFSELPPEIRLNVLATWTEPDVLPRRIAGDSLRAVLGMAYYSNPRVLETIGWRSTCARRPS